MPTASLHPTLILHNAKIFTVDEEQPWAEAIAIRDAQILAVGGDEEMLALAGPQTQRRDLGGRLVLPGLCDAHIHFYDWSLMQREVLLADTRSKQEMLDRIEQRAGETPEDGWITGRGWNESRWGETHFPTKHDLDGVTGERQPAIFWRADLHGAVANSAALRLAGVDQDTQNPPGGVIEHDADGAPNGVLKELAIQLVARHVPEPTSDELDSALRDGVSRLHRLGITALHDQRKKDLDDGPAMLAAMQRLHSAGELRLRISTNVAAHNLEHVAALGLHTSFGDDVLRLGHVKVFSDGSLGSRTAWMLEPFEPVDGGERDNYGVVLTPVEQMAREFRRAARLGFPISVHAIGDRANREVLDILEEIIASETQPALPHRIEHAQTLHPDDVARFAALNITASVQPLHATDDMDTADLLLGARAERLYPFRSLLESGARLALGSDAPVADANPFLGIHAALYRQRPERMAQPAWYPNERLSLAETIRGYTLEAAVAAGWQALIGSLSPGKRADLIVLDRDLFELVEQKISGDEVAGTQVEMTVFDGKIVFEQ